MTDEHADRSINKAKVKYFIVFLIFDTGFLKLWLQIIYKITKIQ
jgi:hypothetical protein